MDKLKELAEFCKTHRINHIKTPEYEFTIELPPSEDQLKAATQLAAIMEKQTEVTDEQILFDPMAGLTEKGDGYAYNEHT